MDRKIGRLADVVLLSIFRRREERWGKQLEKFFRREPRGVGGGK